jgi:ATP-dependent RNA helicase DeaD
MTAAKTDTPANSSDTAAGFEALGLAPELLAALSAVGYEQPTAIQVTAIPHLLAGRDVLGQAQTGTGKTAAFALPMLQRLDLGRIEVQGLVLTPTRELALQVTEAIKTYAQRLGAVRIMTVYGGAPIGAQLTRIERGVHIVVGTPGRVMDCIRRGALKLDSVKMVALDEADEMLRMGFIDDVEWIVGHTPDNRQTALFSATMPGPIRRVAERYLKNPITAAVQEATRTVADIEQRVLCVYPRDKLDALTRMLEVEPSEAVLVFARTQADCADLSDALEYRGFAAAPLHGGMSQSQREDVVRRLRSGRLRLVVATDVAARGLDVEHVSHVINMGPPPDPETYVHRIGRTGRAGRTGIAVLFLTPRERHVRGAIERFTRQRMVEVGIPTNQEISEGRAARLSEAIQSRIEDRDLSVYRAAIEELVDSLGLDPLDVAAALAHLATREQPLVVDGPEPYAVGYRPSPAGSADVVRKGARAPAKPKAAPGSKPAPDSDSVPQKIKKNKKARAAELAAQIAAAALEAKATAELEATLAASEQAAIDAASKAAPKKKAKSKAAAHELAPEPASAEPAPAKAKAKAKGKAAAHELAPQPEIAPEPAAAATKPKARARATTPVAEVESAATAPSAPPAPKKKAAAAKTAPVAAPAPASKPAPVAKPAPAAKSPQSKPAPEGARPTPPAGAATVNLWISQGSKVGLGPGDIVGAIVKEANVPNAAIGPIDIRANHTLVEVDRDFAAQILARMAETRLRGRPASFRPAREPGEGAPPKAKGGGLDAPRRKSPKPRAKPPARGKRS